MEPHSHPLPHKVPLRRRNQAPSQSGQTAQALSVLRLKEVSHWPTVAQPGGSGTCLPSVSPAGLGGVVTDTWPTGQLCSPEARATLTRKPPLATGAGVTPRPGSQGPQPCSPQPRIRGPGPGVNSICRSSFQAASRSVLPATSNLPDKGSVERPGGGAAEHPWESPAAASVHVPHAP